ncbi:GYDIA family GHMP kinase [uncultured Tenacibaculum sp.]|uniref:GYDIA family GHMP kinase n=1 Tax=uncultured Tenacibaculum sp. TaxID=174713 RepID=UPI002605084B|nr:GYDIA family GHMP kinase [uncultured Tenacibaculum sp.]
MEKHYSNGKLLLTGEYLVLDGATSLAVPTKYGQDLTVTPIDQPELIWGSFTNTGECWFEASFDVPKLRLTSATFNSDQEESSDQIAETLQNILQEARKLNPDFLNSSQGYVVKTHLTFPQNWGLGSSSTLINNIASWAKVNPFTLLWNAFSGSGYDIACAKHNSPIFYQLEDKKPTITEVNFSPTFSNDLYFVFLNQKQNSREGIKRYKEKRHKLENEIQLISQISKDLITSKNLSDFEDLLNTHENLVSSIIELPKVKDRLFSDYFGTVKSLGAWGGDFVLATGNNETPEYFKNKGFEIIIPYNEMVL